MLRVVAMETAARLLAAYEEQLAHRINALSDSRGEGVRITLQCRCMTKRQQMAAVYVSAKGEAKTIEAAGRIAPERILNKHAECLELTRPPAKRTWLEAAGIEAAETKKAKSDAAAANAAESADIEKLHKLDRNNTKVL